jgi:hypothetical protein
MKNLIIIFIMIFMANARFNKHSMDLFYNIIPTEDPYRISDIIHPVYV